MQPARYLRLLQRWWWLLGLGAPIGGVSAYGVSLIKTPSYRAEATLLVDRPQMPGIIAGTSVGLMLAGPGPLS